MRMARRGAHPAATIRSRLRRRLRCSVETARSKRRWNGGVVRVFQRASRARDCRLVLPITCLLAWPSQYVHPYFSSVVCFGTPLQGNNKKIDDIFDFLLVLEIGNFAITAPNRTYAPLTCVPPPPQTPPQTLPTTANPAAAAGEFHTYYVLYEMSFGRV